MRCVQGGEALVGCETGIEPRGRWRSGAVRDEGPLYRQTATHSRLRRLRRLRHRREQFVHPFQMPRRGSEAELPRVHDLARIPVPERIAPAAQRQREVRHLRTRIERRREPFVRAV